MVRPTGWTFADLASQGPRPVPPWEPALPDNPTETELELLALYHALVAARGDAREHHVPRPVIDDLDLAYGWVREVLERLRTPSLTVDVCDEAAAAGAMALESWRLWQVEVAPLLDGAR